MAGTPLPATHPVLDYSDRLAAVSRSDKGVSEQAIPGTLTERPLRGGKRKLLIVHSAARGG